jgi:hypothetical protein
MAWRDGRSAYVWRAFLSCSRSRSFSLRVACRNPCGRLTRLSRASSSPSPSSGFSSTSGSWPPGHPRTSVRSKPQRRQASDVSDTVRQLGGCWQVCHRLRSSRSSTPLGRRPGRHYAASTTPRNPHRPGRFLCLASDTKPSFSFSGSIELSGMQSRDWSKASEGSGAHTVGKDLAPWIWCRVHGSTGVKNAYPRS